MFSMLLYLRGCFEIADSGSVGLLGENTATAAIQYHRDRDFTRSTIQTEPQPDDVHTHPGELNPFTSITPISSATMKNVNYLHGFTSSETIQSEVSLLPDFIAQVASSNDSHKTIFHSPNPFTPIIPQIPSASTSLPNSDLILNENGISGGNKPELKDTIRVDEIIKPFRNTDVLSKNGSKNSVLDPVQSYRQPSIILREGDRYVYRNSEKTRPARLMLLRRRVVSSSLSNTTTEKKKSEKSNSITPFNPSKAASSFRVKLSKNMRSKAIATSINGVENNSTKVSSDLSDRAPIVIRRQLSRRRPGLRSNRFKLKIRNVFRNRNNTNITNLTETSHKEATGIPPKDIHIQSAVKVKGGKTQRGNRLPSRRRRIQIHNRAKNATNFLVGNEDNRKTYDVLSSGASLNSNVTIKYVNDKQIPLENPFTISTSGLDGDHKGRHNSVMSTKETAHDEAISTMNDRTVTQVGNANFLEQMTDLEHLSVTSLFSDITKPYDFEPPMTSSDLNKTQKQTHTPSPPTFTTIDKTGSTVVHGNLPSSSSPSVTTAGEQHSEPSDVVISYDRPEQNEIPDTVNIRQNSPPGISVPENTLDERITGSRLNIGQ